MEEEGNNGPPRGKDSPHPAIGHHLPGGEGLKSYSYLATAIWFLAGGMVTAPFSGSLVMMAKNASFAEVLTVGMIVPSFTWVVQMSAAALLMQAEQRKIYLGDLGRICVLGSFALWPAAIYNLIVAQPLLWLSAANVLASVAVMAIALFRYSAIHNRSNWWPFSWCVTITVNMCLFLLSSWKWW